MHYSAEEKAEWLEGWKRSGRSISSFVKENGLVRWTFHKWIKAERGLREGFVEIPARALRPEPHAPVILIEKGNVKIHIPLCLNGLELRSVMEALGVAL